MRYVSRPMDVGSRAGVIGCSDIGAILGVSRFRTRADVLDSFRGVPKEVDEQTAKVFWMGHRLEEVVADYVREDLCISVSRSVDAEGRELAWSREDMQWLVCHPDRVVDGGWGGFASVDMEIKSTTAYSSGWGDEWTDDIPAEYLLQCVGYRICRGTQAIIQPTFYNNRVYYHIVVPDDELVESVVAGLEEFHGHAVDPEWQPAPETYDEAIRRFPLKARATRIEASAEVAEQVREMRRLQEDRKDIEARIDALKAAVTTAMDGNEELWRGGERLAKLVVSNRRTFDRDRAIEEYPALNGDEYWKTMTITSLR